MNKSLKKAAAVILGLVFGVSSFAQETELNNEGMLAAEKNVLTIIEPASVHDLNPKTSTLVSDAQIFSGIYEGLFSYNPSSLDPLPAICENFKISRDKKRWTFYLRENAFFSDGSPITAEDVRRSWIELLATPDAPYSSMLDIISGAQEFRLGKGTEKDVAITVVSDNTLSIRLTKPASYLPRLLCHSAFSVTHRNPTVFSGPFYISDMENQQIILEKNPFYWDAENVQLKVICFFQSLGPDENAYFFNTGFSDWVCSYDIDTEKILDKSKIHINAEFGTEYLFFKENGPNKIWQIPDFRLAVLEAMPWETLRKNSLVRATSFVYPLENYPPVEGFSVTDSSEAKLMMNDARKKAGLSEDERVQLCIAISEKSLSSEDMNAIKDALLPLGVDAVFKSIPFNQYLSYVETPDADVCSYNWIGDFADPLAFLELFRGDSTLNVSKWKNDDFDRLIDEAALADGIKRYEILADAEQILLDSGMVMPIAHPVSLSVIGTEEVGGWYPNAFNIHPLKYIFKKDVKIDLSNCF